MSEDGLEGFEIFRTDLHGWYFRSTSADKTVYWLRRKDRLIYRYSDEEKRWELLSEEAMKRYEPPPEWDNDDGIFDPSLGSLADYITNIKPAGTPLLESLLKKHSWFSHSLMLKNEGRT